MARHSEGWRLKRKAGRKTFNVIFTHGGREIERSTGATNTREASIVAARIYADAVQKEPTAPRVAHRGGDSPPLEELVTLWLVDDTTIAESTGETFTTYGRHWCRKWVSLVHVTDATCVEYRNERLRAVLARTVRHELSAFRKFLAWCTEQGHLTRVVKVPTIPKKTVGQRFHKRRRVAPPELSPAEIEAVLAALPEWSAQGGRGRLVERARMKNRFAVQARFIVAYETGLRPSFLDVISVPEHYRSGRSTITIPAEHDKNRLERTIDLTARARAALDAVCPDIGPIFGKHDYRIPIGRAAAKALSKDKAKIFTAAHFRSAQATHTLEGTGNIPGTMHNFGWTQIATASRYTKPSQRAGREVIRKRDRAALERAEGTPADA